MMKIIEYTIYTLITLSSMLSAQEENNLQNLLDKIKGQATSEHSKSINSSSLVNKMDEVKVINKAVETKNADLVKIVEDLVNKIDWAKQRTWKEGLSIDCSIELEALIKVESLLVKNYKQYFLNAPDVPYDKIGAWHVGYLGRGLQGKILEPLARLDSNEFKKILKLLDDNSVSISKKRTIVWAMRHDLSGFSEKLLNKKLKTAKSPIKEDLVDSLNQLKGNVKFKRDRDLLSLKNEKKLIGFSINDLVAKVGEAYKIENGEYVYATLDNESGDDISWNLKITNDRVSQYKRQNLTNPKEDQ